MKAKRSFTSGAIFTPMLLFVLPVILTNALQTLYNIADHVVVGKFSSDSLALAAIGTSASISTLFLNIVVGLSVGGSVVISQAFGAGDRERVSKSVHTSLTFGLLFGVALSVIAIALARPLLIATGVKTALLSRATLYLVIIFAALPATSVYNFAAAALRAVGDSRTSLIILSASGLLNVALNLVFVLGFGMSVGGVALATAISKYVSAIAAVSVLMKRRDEPYALSLRRLGISKPLLLRMLRFGIPNAVQNSMFSISNVLITSAINTLPIYVLSARTIVFNVINLVNTFAASYTTSAITFAGQNYGAKKYSRVKRSMLLGIVQTFAITTLAGVITLLLLPSISALFVQSSTPDRALILATAYRIGIITLPVYGICGIMNVLSGTLRGIGAALSPMILSIVGVCGFRTLWIYTAFRHPAFHSAEGLYLSYALAWVLVILGLLVVLFLRWKHIPKDGETVEK